MSKTIRQIADELGVSKQAVQKRMSRKPLCTSIQPYISTVHGVKYIDDVGENLIKSAFLENNKNMSIDIGIDKNNNVHTPCIRDINGEKELYDILKMELEAKNKQIEKLQEELAEERKYIREQSDKMAILADQAQKLQLAQMNPRNLLDGNTPKEPQESLKKKQNIFLKIFGSKN